MGTAINALFYLRIVSLKNLAVSRFLRLKQPKYLIGAVVGAAYIYFLVFRRMRPGPAAGRAGLARHVPDRAAAAGRGTRGVVADGVRRAVLAVAESARGPRVQRGRDRVPVPRADRPQNADSLPVDQYPAPDSVHVADLGVGLEPLGLSSRRRVDSYSRLVAAAFDARSPRRWLVVRHHAAARSRRHLAASPPAHARRRRSRRRRRGAVDLGVVARTRPRGLRRRRRADRLLRVAALDGPAVVAIASRALGGSAAARRRSALVADRARARAARLCGALRVGHPRGSVVRRSLDRESGEARGAPERPAQTARGDSETRSARRGARRSSWRALRDPSSRSFGRTCCRPPSTCGPAPR